MDTLKQKQLLRDQFKQRRAEMPKAYRQQAEQSICNKLVELFAQLQIGSVAAYRAFGSEANIDHFCQTSGLELCYPKVHGEDLHFQKADLDSGFEASPWGIPEPKGGSEEVSLQDIDAMIVPGLVFDRRCYRLGYGRGFYDRALAPFNGVTIGVAFKLQIEEQDLTIETHDLPMNYLVTEDFILRPVIH